MKNLGPILLKKPLTLRGRFSKLGVINFGHFIKITELLKTCNSIGVFSQVCRKKTNDAHLDFSKTLRNL